MIFSFLSSSLLLPIVRRRNQTIPPEKKTEGFTRKGTARNFHGPGQKLASPSSTGAAIRALVGDWRGRRLGFCGGGEEEEEANGNGGDGEPREGWEEGKAKREIWLWGLVAGSRRVRAPFFILT
jgi:hypothetical protein